MIRALIAAAAAASIAVGAGMAWLPLGPITAGCLVLAGLYVDAYLRGGDRASS